MRFDTWNVRTMYRAASLRTVSTELSRYRLDLVGVQEVRWEGSGTTPTGKFPFLCGKANKNHE
jgi:exonuclease III